MLPGIKRGATREKCSRETCSKYLNAPGEEQNRWRGARTPEERAILSRQYVYVWVLINAPRERGATREKCSPQVRNKTP